MDPSGTDERQGADDLAEHPGRPREKDEIDPELIRLPRKRARVSPVMASAIAILCGFLMLQLWSDLAFSRAGDEPEVIAIDAITSADDNAYARTKATPDLANLMRVASSDADSGHRAAPVLGSAGGLWILLPGSPWVEGHHYDQTYEGRLYTLGDMPFYEDLSSAVKKLPPVPKPVELERVRKRLTGGDADLRQLTGDSVEVSADTMVEIRQLEAGRALLTVAATDEYQSEDVWRAALQSAGILPPQTEPVSHSEETWTYSVPAPEGVSGVSRALVENKLFAARVAPLRRVHDTTWGELELRGGELSLPGTVIPWSEIEGIAVASRPEVKESARVLVTTERPDKYWYVLPLFVLFALFAGLFTWGAWRAFRAAAAA